MDASQLLVFDMGTRRVVKSIAAAGVHGVLAVPSLHRVFASATDDHQANAIDTRTLSVVARALAGSYPDGLAWDPVKRHVFVSDESGGVETVLNAKGQRIATIQLGGEAGNVQYDAGSKRVLVDVQTKDDIAVIDPTTNKIVRRVSCRAATATTACWSTRAAGWRSWPATGTPSCTCSTFAACGFTGASTVGQLPDVLAFDPKLRRLYVAAESGEVAVFAETAHGARKLGQALLAPAAHTVAVDPRTHLVYFPLQSGSNGTPQLLIMRPS